MQSAVYYNWKQLEFSLTWGHSRHGQLEPGLNPSIIIFIHEMKPWTPNTNLTCSDRKKTAIFIQQFKTRFSTDRVLKKCRKPGMMFNFYTIITFFQCCTAYKVQHCVVFVLKRTTKSWGSCCYTVTKEVCLIFAESVPDLGAARSENGDGLLLL